MTINFFQRKRGRKKRLFARLTFEGKTTELMLDYAMGESASGRKAYCRKVEQELMTLYNNQLLSNKPADVQTIKLMYTTTNRSYFLLKVFRDYVDNKIKPRYEKDEVTQACLQKYNVVFNHLEDFLRCRNMDDINIGSVSREFIDDFDNYLTSFNNHNTKMKHLGYLKCIMAYAKNVKQYITRNPFDEMRLTKKKVIPTFLSDQELERIMKKRHLNKRLEMVRDCFLFQCFTGLAYIDMKNLITTNLEEDYVQIRREKSTEPATVYIYDVAKKILQKYDNKLPVISNAKMNGYLKEIAALCNIEKTLTTHVARHTFATTVNLNKGVPLEVVQILLGHSSIKQTEHYAKFYTATVIDTCRKNNRNLTKFYKQMQLSMF